MSVKDPEKELKILLDFCENFVAKPVDLSTIKSYLAHTGGGTRLREYLQVVNKAIPEIIVQYDCATWEKYTSAFIYLFFFK